MTLQSAYATPPVPHAVANSIHDVGMDSKALPRIVKFLGTDDCGEGGGTSCPHCGASGRYIIRFRVEDGRTLGAMRGCVKLFPVSELARHHQHFIDKQARYANQRTPWKLNARDAEALHWIEEAIDGKADHNQALSIAKSARATSSARYRR